MQEPSKELTASDQLNVSVTNLTRVDNSITFADHKARLGLMIALAVLGAILALLPAGTRTVIQLLAGDVLSVISALLIATLFLAFLISFLGGMVELLAAIRPRLETSTPRDSLLYFDTIRRMDAIEFKERFRSLSYSDAIDEIDDQTHRVSAIAGEKYQHIDNALGKLGWGALFAVIYSAGLAVAAVLTGL